jgi:hypothetical protein
MSLIDKLLAGNLDEAKDEALKTITENVGVQLVNLKTRIATRAFVISEQRLNEYIQTTRRRGRLNYISIRVRRGKVQRRKKVSAVKGYTLRGGKVIRMRPSERLHRRLAARRGKLKRRAKRAQILRRTRIAMRKRRSLGLRAWRR